MKYFSSIDQINNLQSWVDEALAIKNDPFAFKNLGKNKTIGLLFFNSSLRTRLSTQKAAQNLGMEVMIMNVSEDGWGIEFEDGSIMDGTTAEHIKEAAIVVSQYCDIIGVRAFPKLLDRKKDESEHILNGFIKHANVPIVNLESSTEHPLQALTDAITISEFTIKKHPKVVLSWAPHPKILPHAVANSFTKAMQKMDVEFVIANPEGYDLNPQITGTTKIFHNQEEALQNADFVYTKNWCSYENYGQNDHKNSDWIITSEKLQSAYFMHCLPVRRNVVVKDEVLDGSKSLTTAQANNRTFAAQLVIKKLLENG